MRILNFLLAGLICFCAVGCSPRIHTKVDAISAPGSKARNVYVLIPGNRGCDEHDLQYRVFAGQADKALQQAGFIRAATGDDADVCVFLSYGRVGPKLSEHNLSQYPLSGYSSSQHSGRLPLSGDQAEHAKFTTYQPEYSAISVSHTTSTRAMYLRYLKLAGYDLAQFKRDGKEVLLWKTEVLCECQTQHMKEMFPAMLISAQPYFARNLDVSIQCSVGLDDPRIPALKEE